MPLTVPFRFSMRAMRHDVIGYVTVPTTFNPNPVAHIGYIGVSRGMPQSCFGFVYSQRAVRGFWLLENVGDIITHFGVNANCVV